MLGAAFVSVLAPAAGMLLILPVVATVGEFWMIGQLFWKGLRQARPRPARAI